MKLYELNRDIINALENLEEDQDINSLLDQFSDKVEDVCKVIRHMEAKASEAKEEKQRIADVQKYYENQVKSLKSYLSYNLTNQGVENMEAGTFKLAFRKTKSVVFTDEAQIPDSFKEEVTTIKINKNEIKSAWKSAAVPGTMIEESKSLQIK